MAKNNVFYKLPAQILLQDKSVTFSGYLERKIKVLSFKPWIKCYTVISNGNLYIYQTNTSSKPYLVCILSAFDHIEIFKNRVQPPIWVFSLKPMIDSVPEMRFAAPSEREMESWICEIRMGIVQSKNAQLRRCLPKINKGESGDVMEGSIYSSVSERTEVINVLNASENNIYEEPEEVTYHRSDTRPSAPPLHSNMYPSLRSFDRDSLLSEATVDSSSGSVENCLFYGSREEAMRELSRCQLLGSYLVRKDSDRQILTVKCETNFVKYCLAVNPKSERVHILGQTVCFESLDHLLSYYHEHNLPNQNCKLLLPYNFVDSAHTW